MAATPFILPRNSSEQSELKAKEDPLKNKKTGCRCGNATAAPGAVFFLSGLSRNIEESVTQMIFLVILRKKKKYWLTYFEDLIFCVKNEKKERKN